MNTSTKILIAGKEYSSIEEVPPELRDTYQQMLQVLGDNDGDGLPDIFQGNIFNLNREKLAQLKGVVQKLKANPLEIKAALDHAPQASPQANAHFQAKNSRSSGTAIFIMGVIFVGFILMAVGIFLFRSGFFH